MNDEIEALEAEVASLKAQLKMVGEHNQYKASLIHTYHFAGSELLKCNQQKFMGSGVIIEMRSLSGKSLMMPVMIKDGLSNNTINSLLDDMQRSFESAIEFQPVAKRL
jgi:hypothetical protein